MSVVRLGLTGLAMAGVAVVLLALTGDPLGCLRTLGAAPRLAAGGGAETVVLALTGLLAWATWAWGAVGLLLTAASGLPGLPGAVAHGLSWLLLPERLRTAAALALGVGLAVTGPAVATPAGPSGPPDRPPAATGSPGPPDWPADDAPTAPVDGPETAPAGVHVVVAGDCLWRIAEQHLDRTGAPPGDADVAAAVAAWWSANEGVIGADPDLIHPGQELRPPADIDDAGGPR